MARIENSRRTRGVDRFLVFARVIDRDQQCYARYCEPTPRGLAERSSEMSSMPLRYFAVCARLLRVLLASFRISSLREVLRFDRVLLPSCLLPARSGMRRSRCVLPRADSLLLGSVSAPPRRATRAADLLVGRPIAGSAGSPNHVDLALEVYASDVSLCERHVPAGRIIPLILISPM